MRTNCAIARPEDVLVCGVTRGNQGARASRNLIRMMLLNALVGLWVAFFFRFTAACFTLVV